MTEAICTQCGAKLLPRRQFCMNCHARVPGTAGRAPSQTEAIAHEIPTTRRPDVTMVFVPEHREERLRKERRLRRRGIAIAAALLLLSLAALGYWQYRKREQARRTTQRRELAARRELDLYARALDLFYGDFGRYPSPREGLSSLLRRPPTLDGESYANWRGPYIEGDYAVDPWGNEYVYRVMREGAAYQLFSYGPEGEAVGKAFLQVGAGKEP